MDVYRRIYAAASLGGRAVRDHAPTPTGLEPGEETEIAVRDWLLAAAAESEEVACRDWKQCGVALLRCGSLFCPVRISAQLVHAAAGATETNEVDAYLARALLGGPVFTDRTCSRYYALVRRGVGDEHRWKAHDPHAVGLSAGSFLGVPDPACIYPYDRASYWCVPVKGPSTLCTPSAVEQLIVHGRFLLAAEDRRADA